MHMRCNGNKKLLYFCWLYIYILAGRSMPKLTHKKIEETHPPTYVDPARYTTPNGKKCNAN